MYVTLKIKSLCDVLDVLTSVSIISSARFEFALVLVPFFLNEKWKGIFILTAGAISYYITKRKSIE